MAIKFKPKPIPQTTTNEVAPEQLPEVVADNEPLEPISIEATTTEPSEPESVMNLGVVHTAESIKAIADRDFINVWPSASTKEELAEDNSSEANADTTTSPFTSPHYSKTTNELLLKLESMVQNYESSMNARSYSREKGLVGQRLLLAIYQNWIACPDQESFNAYSRALSSIINDPAYTSFTSKGMNRLMTDVARTTNEFHLFTQGNNLVHRIAKNELNRVNLDTLDMAVFNESFKQKLVGLK